MALVGWDIAKRVKVVPGEGLIPSPLSSFACPLHLGSASGLASYDCGAVFSELDPVDPYWANVELALPFDGANGSTIFTDISSSPKTITRGGSAEISTALSKFGGSSLYLDGNDLLNCGTSSAFNFGADPFTVEMWINRISSGSTYKYIASRYYTGANRRSWAILVDNSNLLVAYLSTGGDSATTVGISSGVAPVAGTWYHVALVGTATQILLFVDGVLKNQRAHPGALLATSDPVYIGNAYGQSSYFAGYIDDLRITTGVARYTADFMPPERGIVTTAPGYSGENPLRRKIAIEVGTTGVELPIDVVDGDWDQSAGTATLYPTFSTLEEGDVYYLYYDSSHADNTNVSLVGSAPSAPSSGDPLTVWNLAFADILWLLEDGRTYIYAALIQRYELDITTVDIGQPYTITSEIGPLGLEQIYSLTMEQWLQQLYGDVPVLSKGLIQPYRGAAILEKELQQKWGAALEIDVWLTQPWGLPKTLTPALVQDYGIAAAVLQLTSEQLYHIHENSELFTRLIQPYAMAAEAAQLYVFDTRVYVDGEQIPYVSCEWQATKAEYGWHADISVKSQEIAQKCAEGAEIVIVSAGDSYYFKCYDGWSLDKRYRDTTYRIEAWSPTRDLDLATPLTGEYSGMASEIAGGLAAPHGIAVDWQMVDGHVAAGKLSANNETPLAVIRKLVEDGGRGRLMTSADGSTLMCVCAVETPLPQWPTVVPTQIIDARIERRATTWQNDIQPGHNRFIVSDQLAAGQSERLIDTLIDRRTADVRLYVTPMADAPGYTLEHSGGVSVSIEPMGIASETVADELVVIEGGIGRTSLPIYGVVARSWRERNLGDIVFGEDGIIQAATAGYSLLELSYTTSFYRWIARDSKIDEVLFVARRAD